MQESVVLDLKGEVHLDFDEHALVHVRTGLSRLRIVRRVAGRIVATNLPMPYSSVEWIGEVRRRQWWLLLFILPSAAFGLLSLASGAGWGPQVVAAGFALPLLFVLVRGRPFLGIASKTRIVLVEMDQKKDRVGRILGLLWQRCPSESVRWDLARTEFADHERWDRRAMQHTPFNARRYTTISAILGVGGAWNLAVQFPKMRPSLALIAIAMIALTIARARRVRRNQQPH